MQNKYFLLFLFMAVVSSCQNGQPQTDDNWKSLHPLTTAEVLELAYKDKMNIIYADFINEEGQPLTEAQRAMLNQGKMGQVYLTNPYKKIKKILVRPITLEDKFLDIQLRAINKKPLATIPKDTIACDQKKAILQDIKKQYEVFQQEYDAQLAATSATMPDFQNSDINRDSLIRQAMQPLFEMQADRYNIHKNKVINFIESCGFPTLTEIDSSDMSMFMFMLDTGELLGYYYQQIKAAYEQGDITKPQFAKVQDELLATHGYQQLYGTKVYISKTVKRLPAIYEIDSLNIRRSIMELPPIEDNFKAWEVENLEELLVQ